MEEEQQEPLTVKDHDEHTCAPRPSIDSSRNPSPWKGFGVNFMVHYIFLAIYTICSFVAINNNVLLEPHSQLSYGG